MRLKHDGLSPRAIAQACSVDVGTVSEYARLVREAGLSWPLPEDLDDMTLEARFFRQPFATGVVRRDPDLPCVHRELRRSGVTLQLLWHEHVAALTRRLWKERFAADPLRSPIDRAVNNAVA